MIPQLSLVTGYRNREIDRVRRFLDSLQAQTYREFELIFVDYGSDSHLSDQAKALCSSYAFCTYLFSDTRGQVWNRAHALNIGIQRAVGQYFLSADIDLIYSKGVLSALMSSCNQDVQLFCKAHLLPRTFRNHTDLTGLPLNFSLTKSSTLGLFHCVLMEHVRTISGYDEYYRIWGFEDKEFAQRLEQLGLQTVWLDEKAHPIYHQWHPSGNRHFFMEWWWEDMTIYDTLHKTKREKNYSWGRLLTTDERPLLQAQHLTVIHCPMLMNSFERRNCIVEILNLLQQNPGKSISVELYRNPGGKQRDLNITSVFIGIFSGGMNRFLRFTRSRHQLHVLSRKSSVRPMLYFFYQLIFTSDFLQDYSIQESPGSFRFILMSKTKNERER